jgi:hypothetical protein
VLCRVLILFKIVSSWRKLHNYSAFRAAILRNTILTG